MTTSNDVVLCSEKNGDETCGATAVARYRWQWGVEGTCCGKHQFLLQQSATNLEQGIQFSPLAPPPAPLGRDERITLHATRLALEDEIKELKARGLLLFQENERLKGELRRSIASDNANKEKVRELSLQLRDTETDRDELRAQLAEATDEILTLRSLVDCEPTPAVVE